MGRLLLLALLLVAVAIGAVSGATSSQRQVGGFVAQVPPQTTAPTQQPEPAPWRHRRIQIKPGVALTSRLEPEDKVVEVVMEGTPFIDPMTDPEAEIRGFTSVTPAVAVIGVGKRESVFTAITLPGSIFYSPEDWIRTTLTADVRSVLKDTTGRLVEGGLIEIVETGGEMVLDDGRRIIARHAVIRPTKIGGTYLAFLSLYEGRFILNTLSTVEFDNGTVKRLRRDAPPESGLEKQSPEWVIQQVRANAHRRKPQ